eukprot:1759249-Pyramimonas_sp.AAC.1
MTYPEPAQADTQPAHTPPAKTTSLDAELDPTSDLDHLISDPDEDTPPQEPRPQIPQPVVPANAGDSEAEHGAKANQRDERPAPFQAPDQDTRTMDDMWAE